MNEELKKTLDALNRAFEDFRNSNDERLKQIEARGAADPLLIEKVDKANKDISDLQAKLTTQERNLREVENAAARPALGTADAQAQERTHAAQFFSLVRQTPVNSGIGDANAVTEGDLTAYRAYRHAFAQYLRRGEAIGTDVRAALSVGGDPAGGYWVTPDTTGRIVEFVRTTSPMRQYASVEPISTDAYEGFNDLDEADSGWVGETAPRTETRTPEIGKWRIPMHEQYANPRTTQKNLDDSAFDVEGWLTKKVGRKLSRKENAAFVNGDGSLKPRGILTYAGGAPTATDWKKIAQVKSGASGAFASSAPGDKLIDMMHGIKGDLRSGSVWFMNRLTLAEVRKLKDGQGNYLWIPNFQQGTSGLVLGYGVAEFDDMPDIASASLSIGFGNLREAYQIADHTIGIRTLRDPFTNKPYVHFYTTKRVGGDVINFEAINLMKFSA